MGRKKKKKLQQGDAITAAAEIKQAPPVEAKPEETVPPSTGPVAEPAPETVSTAPETPAEEPPTITPSVAAEVEAENANLTASGSEPMPEQTSEIQPEAPATEETSDISKEADEYLTELKERALQIEAELNRMDTPQENIEALETELAQVKAQISELEPDGEIDM